MGPGVTKGLAEWPYRSTIRPYEEFLWGTIGFCCVCRGILNFRAFPCNQLFRTPSIKECSLVHNQDPYL